MVYSHQDVQYINGKLFGVENGELTKTLLSVMIKSVAGKYHNIVSMVLIVNIYADKLYSIWKYVVSQMIAIGFDIAGTMTDGHSSNMKPFNIKILKNVSENLSVPNYENICSYIFLLFDPPHLFKNVYNNWMVKKIFDCPHVDSSGSMTYLPKISHLKELYDIESGKSQKMAYKLTEKVLHPQSIEKTSVKLAECCISRKH